METIKEITIKNGTYYFYNDIINLDEFDESKIKVDKRSHRYLLSWLWAWEENFRM